MSEVVGETNSMSAQIMTATALFVAGWVAYDYLSNKFKKRSWLVVPGEVPILGHLPLIVWNGFGNVTKSLERFAEDYAAESGMFEVSLGPGERYIVLSRIDLAMAVLQKRPFVVRRPAASNKTFCSVGAKGIITAEGEQWRNENRILRPTLNRNNVQDYLPPFRDVSERLITKWKKQVQQGEAVTVDDDLFRATADSITTVAMERKVDFINHPESTVSMDVDTVMKVASRRFFVPVPFYDIPIIGQYLDGGGWSIHRLEKLIHETIDKFEVEQEREDANESSNVVVDSNNKPPAKKSFISKMYAMMKSEKMQLSRERLVGNIITMFAAGVDTTGKLLSTAIFLLASKPDLYQELRHEALDFDVNTSTINEMFESLPKLKSFLHETHRNYTNPVLPFVSMEPLQVGNTLFPKGTKFFVMMQYLTTQKLAPSPDVPNGPNGEPPCEFCPMRWLRKDETTGKYTTPTPTGSAIMGFGYGARICPGRTYSEVFSLLVLVKFLGAFESIDLTTPPESHKIISDVLVKYDKAIQFKGILGK